VPENPYNAVHYPTYPRQDTHPDRLATVATLLGMCPAPVTNCRVLEVGCGDGWNILPMAYHLRGSRFVGVDLAGDAIEAGRKCIAALDLGNIALEVADICDIGTSLGEFDYIIAHGVYSWVPSPVRKALLEACRTCLAPQGVAFISYNAYPGRNVNEMLRTMLLYHTRGTADPVERIAQSRAFLNLLLEHHMLPPEWGTLIESEVKRLQGRTDAGLFHDDLASVNDAFYFRDFAREAAAHGLQYLGEAPPALMFDKDGSLSAIDDVIEREQYLDFLRMRGFRQTLLCHQGIPLNREITRDMMERYHFSAEVQDLGDGKLLGMRKVQITSMHEAVPRVAKALGDVYPLPLQFDDLIPYAGDRDSLSEILFDLFRWGFVEVHVFDYPCQETVTEKPLASRLVRYQASVSSYVTSACHHMVELDEIGRCIVMLLDGTRDLEQLTRVLFAIPDGPPLEQIRQYLPASLEWMAGKGLFEVAEMRAAD
jgi:methyltransferase-like protein